MCHSDGLLCPSFKLTLLFSHTHTTTPVCMHTHTHTHTHSHTDSYDTEKRSLAVIEAMMVTNSDNFRV